MTDRRPPLISVAHVAQASHRVTEKERVMYAIRLNMT